MDIMFNLNAYLVSKREKINSALDKILGDFPGASRLENAMRYSLMGDGKRLRPVLCIAAAEAVGGRATDVLPAACAFEMIHTYSLIHDDLPAMDDDDLRRGKPTCHVAFDEATAILAGDALLTLAFQTLSSADGCCIKNQASKWLGVVHKISFAAGYKGLIEGQMRDIAFEGTRLSLNELEAMHSLKTGALIEAAICSGAILADGSYEQVEQLEIYAKNIGLAFQVADDILNVEGNPSIMGKAAGTDKTRKKSTYPSILGIEKSKIFAERLVNNALQALEGFDNRSDPLRAIAGYVIKRKR